MVINMNAKIVINEGNFFFLFGQIVIDNNRLIIDNRLISNSANKKIKRKH